MIESFHWGFTMADTTELWDRWQRGESTQVIGQAFGKHKSSIYVQLAPDGGIRPAPKRRSRLALTLSEREEISRGIAAQQSIRTIATLLGRSPSTISREIHRNGGYDQYRAALADEQAWANACRPKRCKLASFPSLRRMVVAKLRLNWSPEQIAGSQARNPDVARWVGQVEATDRFVGLGAHLGTVGLAEGELPELVVAEVQLVALAREQRHESLEGREDRPHTDAYDVGARRLVAGVGHPGWLTEAGPGARAQTAWVGAALEVREGEHGVLGAEPPFGPVELQVEDARGQGGVGPGLEFRVVDAIVGVDDGVEVEDALAGVLAQARAVEDDRRHARTVTALDLLGETLRCVGGRGEEFCRNEPLELLSRRVIGGRSPPASQNSQNSNIQECKLN